MVYPYNTECSWLIYPSGATSIFLKFDSIDVYPGDYIRVYKGLDESGELLGEFNNDLVPGEQLIADAEMYLLFVSDGSKSGSGFTARYRMNGPVGTRGNEFIAGLRIYPNPVSGMLHIEFSSPVEAGLNLRLYNSLVQPVVNRKMHVVQGPNHASMDLSGLPPGMYYLQISSKQGISTGKVIVY
jgi:hypothetical protein